MTIPEGAYGHPSITASGWAHFHQHSVTATVVMKHPNVDGVLCARGVNLQMPPPAYLGSIPTCGCLRPDQAGRLRRPIRLKVRVQVVAHKGEKPWSARVSQCQATKQKTADRERPCGVSLALIIRHSRVQAPAAPLPSSVVTKAMRNLGTAEALSGIAVGVHPVRSCEQRTSD